jgi:glutamate--cysteine ligase
MKGVLYDDVARAAAYAIMDGPTGPELQALHQDVAVRGFQAVYRGRQALSLCEELLDVAQAGLARIGAKNWRGEDEGKFLKPLVECVQDGTTFAERLLARYRGEWNGSLDPLWDAIEFWPDAEEGSGESAP